jgi:probable HAF family extracellular repeat protein
MSFKNFLKSLTSTSSRRRPIRRSPPASRLCLEALEDRCVPSAYSIVALPLSPQDVNAHGQVVGQTLDGFGPAVLWQDGTLTNLGSLAGPGGWSIAYAINDAGQVVGSTQVTPGGFQYGSAFLITPEDTDQDGSPDHWYRDNNQDGVNDLMVALPAFSETGNGAWDINSSGQVVGSSGAHAVLWQNAEIIDLGSLVASYTYNGAYGINDAGQVVGRAGDFAFLLNPEDTNGDGAPDRWYRDADSNGANDLMVAVGQYGFPYGGAAAINAGGQVVGTDGYFRFLWTPSALSERKLTLTAA